MTAVETKPAHEAKVVHSLDHLFGHPLPECPRCGFRHLETVVDDEWDDVNFSCPACNRCWHVALGFAQPIASAACLSPSKV